ncbi:hypothetical protein OSB04_002216 [Centaurea solstitialis]|uniref:Uncharacterized protein n=1 Tax=Centaurea solstitialis TaxID=347529 RepID=A0AA38TSI7_9ASTR|nr:hypothetical protein OSB04_002216 [Centaurea solstitialis]
METFHIYCRIIIIVFFIPFLCVATDIITITQPLSINRTLISSREVFELGFFDSSDNNIYLGIWYRQIHPRTCPVNSSFVKLTIGKDGNINLVDRFETAIWSSNQSVAPSTFNTVAQLLDSENDNNPETYVWQSFDYPTDTLLPGMKLGWSRKTGINRFLKSWKSDKNPGSGDYSFKVDINGIPEINTWHKETKVTRSGPWNGKWFSGTPGLREASIMQFEFQVTHDDIYYSYRMLNSSVYSRLTINSSGNLQRLVWSPTDSTWSLYWNFPRDICDNYDETCGRFGVCDTDIFSVCKCLSGFRPRDEHGWFDLQDGSSGCVRSSKLDCGSDGFLALKNMKLPEGTTWFIDQRMNLSECGEICKRNCSCTAYAIMDVTQGGSGCIFWLVDLVDMRQYTESENGGQDLYVRVAASDLEWIKVCGNLQQWWRGGGEDEAMEVSTLQTSSLASNTWHKETKVTRSGPWNGKWFSGTPGLREASIMQFEFQVTHDDIYYSYRMLNSSVYSRLTINSSGNLQRLVWSPTDSTWSLYWNFPRDICDNYDETCGRFGVCDTDIFSVCKCLSGFRPRDEHGWFDLQDGSSGCVRSSKLDCGSDGFLALKNMKLPEGTTWFIDQRMNLSECGEICKRNCSCTAYAIMDVTQGGSGCIFWLVDLVDMRQYTESENGGQDLYVRVAASDLEWIKVCGNLQQWWRGGGEDEAMEVSTLQTSSLASNTWHKETKVTRSGPWNGKWFSGTPGLREASIMQFEFQVTHDDIYYSYRMLNSSVYSRLTINSSGNLQRLVWSPTDSTWSLYWNFPRDICDNYDETCGRFGVCDTDIFSVCKCLSGFRPRDEHGWFDLQDGSSGCVRSSKLDCGSDGFLALKNMKLPEGTTWFIDQRMNLSECGEICKRNCSCTAYAIMDVTQGGSGCIFWLVDLVDMRQYTESENGGQDLYVRVAASDLGFGRVDKGVRVLVSILPPNPFYFPTAVLFFYLFLISIFIIFVYRLKILGENPKMKKPSTMVERWWRR